MKRREFNNRTIRALGAGTLGAIVAGSLSKDKVGNASGFGDAFQPMSDSKENDRETTSSNSPSQIGMLIYPGLTALDMVGPHACLSGLLNVQVHLLWKTRDLIVSDAGIPIQPTMTFKDSPEKLDVLFVPGGTKGTWAVMADQEVLEFLKDRGSRASYVTSVCSGSMVLGAAGLLTGYKATSHWSVRDLLPLLGAELAPGRVVEDRNRITGGGVTAGIDFGLTLAARMRSEAFAKMLQLMLEYDPHPPFHSGSPEAAGPALTNQLRTLFASSLEEAHQAALAARKRLNLARSG